MGYMTTADGLRKTRGGNDAGDEKTDRQDAPGADQQRDGEREQWSMNADRIVALAGQQHQGQRGRGEQQLDDHVGGEDGLRTQRRGAQPLEDAALAVDGDDGDQRKHRADGNQKRRKNRETDAEKTAGGE